MENIQSKIDDVKLKIAECEKDMDNFELDTDDYEEQYNEALNCDGEIHIAGLTFDADVIIRELDPIAYRCGLNDYIDGIDKEEDPKYKELEERLENLRDELDGLESIFADQLAEEE